MVPITQCLSLWLPYCFTNTLNFVFITFYSKRCYTFLEGNVNDYIMKLLCLILLWTITQTSYYFFFFFNSGTDSSQLQDDLSHYREMLSKQENELQTLRSEFDLLSSDLELRKELTSELQVQVQNLEKKAEAADEEARGAAQQLSVALGAKKSLAEEVGGRNGKNCRHRFLFLNVFISILCALA